MQRKYSTHTHTHTHKDFGPTRKRLNLYYKYDQGGLRYSSVVECLPNKYDQGTKRNHV
jgi:hypothetical protein